LPIYLLDGPHAGGPALELAQLVVELPCAETLCKFFELEVPAAAHTDMFVGGRVEDLAVQAGPADHLAVPDRIIDRPDFVGDGFRALCEFHRDRGSPEVEGLLQRLCNLCVGDLCAHLIFHIRAHSSAEIVLPDTHKISV